MFARAARRVAILAVVGVAVAAAAAAAATWIDVINFSRKATIDESAASGNYRIWGLGYAKLIVGAEGNNVLVGDGHCPPGATDADYCTTDPIKGSGADHVIEGGGGWNEIYSGYGPHEKLYGGKGSNFIHSAPTTSTIYGGPSGDVIDADQGSTTVYPGTGSNLIDARSPGRVDYVYCTGTHDYVYAYPQDVIRHCAHVFYAFDHEYRKHKATHR
jgi:hypothetical protein